MKRLLGVLVLFGVLLLGACGGDDAGEIEAHEPWARPALQGENGAIYFTIHNHTNLDDALLSVTSDIADLVEVHETIIDSNGVMKMNYKDSVALVPDAEIDFAPGGLHVMLIGLKKELKVGDTFEATLHFKTHPEVKILVTVIDAAGGNMDMGGMETHTP